MGDGHAVVVLLYGSQPETPHFRSRSPLWRPPHGPKGPFVVCISDPGTQKCPNRTVTNTCLWPFSDRRV